MTLMDVEHILLLTLTSGLEIRATSVMLYPQLEVQEALKLRTQAQVRIPLKMTGVSDRT